MSTTEQLLQLDHLELDRLIATTRPRDWEPGEREQVEAMLAACDTDQPAEVLPPVHRAA